MASDAKEQNSWSGTHGTNSWHEEKKINTYAKCQTRKKVYKIYQLYNNIPCMIKNHTYYICPINETMFPSTVIFKNLNTSKIQYIEE